MTPDTPHSVLHDGRRHPAPDGIPFLRAGRDALAEEALGRLDAGDHDGALILLLADQDDWWRGPRAEPDALHELVRRREVLTLRQAMSLLAWGPVADYFAHRWSDPTFLAGLALVDAHWTAPRTAFELACGIGQHLRELSARDVDVTGVDVVFAKLWLARHWVCPKARLLCVDAAQDWPALGPFDLVACHDAFYFLEPKAAILARLRGLVAPGAGLLAIGHVHNRDWPNLSAGAAVTAGEMAALLPDATLYDDAELTRALVEARAPRPAEADALHGAEAFAAVAGPGLCPPREVGRLALPRPGTVLRRNPLYDEAGRIAWPSERYAREYGPRATYPPGTAQPEIAVLAPATAEAARRRELIDLPERW
jgi:2-polyprenyl-3-methyl-5-hydroxy-6-metoxy-1,4-benzoquinol methylase